MLCNQCSMSLSGGCTVRGVCGKDPDLNSLQDALIYGIKGTAAYYYHALEMGYDNPEIGHFLAEALYSTLTNVNFDKNRFIDLILENGRIHLEAMKLLDKAYTETFGLPKPVEVPTGTTEGHGIVVTGHSYKALYELLNQIREMGLEEEIKVYTHSEMLPAHSYPEIRKFKSLYGNWGGSWVYQRKEFAEFPGVIIGTSNCVQQPTKAYQDRIFTVGIAGLEGVPHLEDYDFEPAIKRALETPKMGKREGEKIVTGFHHTYILAMKDKLIELINEGKIRHIFVIGGCDVPNPKMSYYEKLTELVPRDAIILSAACGKFRYNRRDYGSIEGIPRFMDFGQCNNVYSIIEIALALAKELDMDINSLPVSIVLSWMEQKAIGILYTLLYLGVKGIYIGPKSPEFLTPRVFEILRKQFDLRLISEPEKDLREMLSKGISLEESAPLAEELD
ncbi:hydroxylamine reductase [Pyrococcus abyssi]|uniref:Hydroxylamine reductase n=1 Tax=Pyrococcus abyssi (strain GE5 / Orsay) TaxID=272844 RepID=Q9V000_PYRAB|nr:hydroxylamine reductase [Pyrococcus abyssi]CAB49906.1 Prismane protein homolog [Pyrococcus abyssi GE5]CCE70404.1 TPA: hydroxylamine reductase [Pyrococcus abyssi GE5]